LPLSTTKERTMKVLKFLNINLFLVFLILTFLNTKANSEEEQMESIINQIQIIAKDLKTLEKAVYKSSDVTTTFSADSLNEDVLTKHLLKLNEIENQFRELTNRFEEVNFKLDKLSNRVTKIQSDNQLRFNLPGTDKPQDFGAAPGYKKTSSLPETQQTQSIETAGTVITEKPETSESLLPDKSPAEQYEFAVSFMKIGDYETAEFALKEFIDKNKDHDLAGNAQYWYGETFRIRQLYSDAASAYLDGYQNYPKSKKAPDNLLKLGITMVQLGEKDQGCSMINGIKKQYPKASKSVLQKAQYEQKKFKCAKS
jgi:tol-pal system protein YbgF